MVRKRVVVITSILLIGAGLWAWIALNAGSEWKANLAGLIPQKAAATAVHGDPFAQIGANNVQNQKNSWGGILVKGCEAGMADFEAARFDTDGDGVADKVCWRMIQIGKDGQTGGSGDFVGVAVIAKNPDGTVRRRGYAVVPAKSAPSDADHLTISRKAWSDKELSEHQWSGGDLASPVSVAVTQSGEAAWLFWPKTSEGDAVPLIQENQPN